MAGMTEEKYAQVSADLGAFSTRVTTDWMGRLVLDFETGSGVLDDANGIVRLTGVKDEEIINAVLGARSGAGK